MGGNKTPLVSILTASFNHEKYVGFYIESVLSQTNPNWELIIVDDCSVDNTVAEIKKFDDSRIRLIQHPFNKGINCSLMTALGEAQGKYVVLCASDDMLMPHFVQTVVDYMEKHPEVGVFYPKLQYIDMQNNLIPNKKNTSFQGTKYEILKKMFYEKNCLISPGQVIRRSVFTDIQPLDIAMSQHQDYKIHIQLLLNTDCFVSPEKLVLYRNPSSASGISYVTPSSKCRCDLEENLVMEAFLNINYEQMLSVFGSDLEQFGPDLKSMFYKIKPFVLGKLALKSDNEYKKIWGYNKIVQFINNPDNYNLLNHLYGFCYKDFLNLVSDFIGYGEKYKLNKKYKKYKKFFNLLVVINILLIVLVVFVFMCKI